MMTTNTYQVPWWRTSFGDEEVEKLRESVSEQHISQGAVTAEFESQFAQALGVPYAVATTSGSAALLLSLMALGIDRDDEVIVPSRTWIASAHAVLMAGGKVKLVDVWGDFPVMDVSLIRQAITPRTKAIMPVHLNGRSVDMTEIGTIAREHNLYVVEDACQALFSRNPTGYLGTQSDAGCFSFSVTKLVSTGQGGMVVTHSLETYEKLKLVRNHGVVDNFTESWNELGFNFKFTDLQASFGVVQLTRAAGRIQRVNQVYVKYASALDELDFPFLKLIPVNLNRQELPLYVEALSDEKDQLIEFLNDKGIQARPFAPSLHTSDSLRHNGSFLRSDMFHQKGLFLPSGPDQPTENIDRVIDTLRDYKVRQ